MPVDLAEDILTAFRRARASGDYTWYSYQPIELPGFEETLEVGRLCSDRAEAIFADLDARFGRPASVVDWGCNHGYFVRAGARRGHTCVGVDCNPKLVAQARALCSMAPLARIPIVEDSLSPPALDRLGPFDAAICLSVLHHLPWAAQCRVLDVMSRLYDVAYVEMDAAEFGRLPLEVFFYEVEAVAEANDAYGKGTKRRVTWRCTNRVEARRYRQIKRDNFIYGRGVFSKSSGDETTVIKRESRPESHTWIRTGLGHEADIYERYSPGCRWMPKLVRRWRDERFLIVEIERVEPAGRITRAALETLFGEMAEARLFVFGLRTDAIIPTADGLKVIDLETVFEVDGDIETQARSLIRSDKKAPWTSYRQQFEAIARFHHL